MPRDTPASQEKERRTELAGIPWGSTTHEVHRWLSPRYCFLPLHLFTGTTCPFQGEWGTAGRKFSVNTSFWSQTGFSTKQNRLQKNLIFHLKAQVSQKAHSSQFPALQGSIIFRLGEKCFFWLEEVTILLVFIQYRVLWATPLESFWWQCHLVWTTTTLMSLHIPTGAQRDNE